MTRRRRIPRIALLLSILAGIAILLYFIFISNIQAGDFQRYYYAAKQAQAGEPFVKPYNIPQTELEMHYVYPPITVFFFYPFTLFPTWQLAFAAHVVLSVVCAGATLVLVIRYIESQGIQLESIDKLLISGLFLVGPHAIMTYAHGQVTYYVALAICAGYILLEKRDEVGSGLLFSFPAILKVFPALFGLWLAKKRAWKTIGTWALAGVSATVLSFVIFGMQMHISYIEYLSNERSRIDWYRGGLDPNIPLVTPNRALSQLFPNAPSIVFSAAPLLLALGIIGFVYYQTRLSEAKAEIVAFLVTTICIIFATPSYPNYLLLMYFPLITSLYTIPRIQLPLGIGLVIASVSVGPEEVSRVLSLTGIPAGIRLLLEQFVTAVLSIASPGLIGATIILAGCITYLTKKRNSSSI